MSTTEFRIDARTFRRMAAAGMFGDTKVELLNGHIEMMTSGPAHDFAVTALRDALTDRLPRADWTVREEKPLRLGRYWRPVPDLAVVRGSLDSYRQRTPGRLETALVVEVSDTTYPRDAGRKLARYVRCGIPAYWVLDLNRRLVEVRAMQAAGGPVLATYADGQDVPLTLDGRAFAPVPVADLLP